MSDSIRRFSNRADDYVKYRPGYPPEIIDLLRKEIQLTPRQVIADIGSGTEISSEMFLKNGNIVCGIEPNKEMRSAAEKSLKEYKYFIGIDGQAEKTQLNERSIDIIIAAQSFHWFDRKRIKKEWPRILKIDGYVVLLWNERKRTGSQFLAGYELLIKKFAKDYEKVRHLNIDSSIFRDFFKSGSYETVQFKNEQVFGFEGLKGRALSSSYMPAEGEVGHEMN